MHIYIYNTLHQVHHIMPCDLIHHDMPRNPNHVFIYAIHVLSRLGGLVGRAPTLKPNCMMTLIMQIMQSILKCTIFNLFRTVLLVLHMHSTLHVVSLV